MDLYDILGIKKNASKDEIKKAYRRKAAKAHPDRAGGSEDKMSELNQAYALLMDDGKRAEYDFSGATFQPSVSQEATDHFIQMLNVAVDGAQTHGQVLGYMWEAVKTQVGDITHARTENAKFLKVYRQREKKIKYKGKGVNLFKEVIANKIRGCEASEMRCARALQVMDEVKKLLADYESEPDDSFYGGPRFDENSAAADPTADQPKALGQDAKKRLNKIFP